jgi:hypothetical protein
MKEIGISLTQADVEAGDWSEPPVEGPRSEGAPLNLGEDPHEADPLAAVPHDPEKPARI